MKRISRRNFLKLTGGVVGAAIVGSALDALATEPYWFKVTRPTVHLPKLLGAWAGVRIALLTDLHMDPRMSLRRVRRIVELTNDQRPDLVVFTGDLTSHFQFPAADLAAVLGGLSAPLGKFAVPGNHDYWTRLEKVAGCLRAGGFTMLVNSHRVLRRQDQPLVLAGLDDLWAGQPNVTAALRGLEVAAAGAPRIALCHNPDYAEALADQPRVDLMLSGHTHGGQVKVPLGRRPVLPIDHAKYAAGLVAGPHCQVYTSVGLGMVGPHVRYNCRPEIAILTLQAA